MVKKVLAGILDSAKSVDNQEMQALSNRLSALVALQKRVQILKTLKLAEPLKHSGDYADSLMELAVEASELGKYVTAIHIGTLAVEEYRLLLDTDPSFVGCKIFRAQINLGKAYNDFGDYETAIDQLSDVINKAEKSQHADSEKLQVFANAHWNLACAWSKKGEHDRAEKVYRLAADMFADLMGYSAEYFSWSYGAVKVDLARCLRLLDNFEEAGHQIDEGISFLALSNKDDFLASAFFERSVLYESLNNEEAALFYAKQTIKIIHDCLCAGAILYHPLFLLAIYRQISILTKREKFKSPKAICKRARVLMFATAWYEDFRSLLPDPFDHDTLDEIGRGFYLDMAAHYLFLGQHFRERSSMERCLTRCLISLELSMHRRLHGLMDPGPREQIQRHLMVEGGRVPRRYFDDYFDQSGNRLLRPQPPRIKNSDSSDSSHLRPRDVIAFHEDQAIASVAPTKNEEQTELPKIDSATFVDLRDDELLVYTQTTERGIVMVLTWNSDTAYWIIEPENCNEIDKELRRWMMESGFYRHITLPDRSNCHGSIDCCNLPYFSECVLKPLLDEAPKGIKRVLLCGDRFLSWFPMEWIECDGSSMGKRFEVCRVLSYGSYVKRGISTPNGNALLVTNPTDNLPLASFEGVVISGMLSCAVLDGCHASRESVIKEATHCGIFHYSGHAAYDKNTPYSSRLCTSDGLGISTSDCFGEFRLAHCNLAFLNGCETAQGFGPSFGVRLSNFHKIEMGGLLTDHINLALGMYAAGARCVIGTLWETPDISSALISWKFYRCYIQYPNAASALRESLEWIQSISSGEELVEKVMPDFLNSLYNAFPADIERCRTAFEFVALESKCDPPFAHPKFWAGYVIWGHPDSIIRRPGSVPMPPLTSAHVSAKI